MTDNINVDLATKWGRLVEKLVQQTGEGDLDWSESAKSNEFILNVGDNSLKFGQGKNRDGEDLYYVRIENGFGEVVEVFDDEDLKSLLQDPYPDNYFGKMERLHSKIRRLVTRADEVLDDVLNWLEKNDKIPF